MDIYGRKIGKMSKRQGTRRRKTRNRSENWTYIEERKGKYPKDRVPGEGRQEIEVKIGHIVKKEKENIQKTVRSEKEDMKWNGKLDIK